MSINVNVNMPTCSAINCVNRQFKVLRKDVSSVSTLLYNVINYLWWFNMLLSDKYCTLSTAKYACLLKLIWYTDVIHIHIHIQRIVCSLESSIIATTRFNIL